MRHGYDLRRGAALLLALAVTAIISALLSGILLLSVSHLALSTVDNNYANALNLAEAGINWELWKISHDVGAADQTPLTVEFPTGSQRTFAVRVEADTPSGGPWVPPNDCRLVSTGTVGRVSRTVRVVAQGVGIFGKYALFGIDTLDVGGNATINGATGTNGVSDLNGLPNFRGNFWLCGSGATGDSPGDITGDVLRSPLPEDFPTVNEVATEWAEQHYGATGPQTVDFFRTHNDNATITDGASNPVTISGYRLDKNLFIKNSIDRIVLGPGDYYFEEIDLPAGYTVEIDPGQNPQDVVNIWIGPQGGLGKPDTINGHLLFDSSIPSQFNLYDGSARTLKMNGTMDFYGNFLVYNGPSKSGTYYGTVEILGTGRITGSVIGYDVYRTTGNAEITFPSSGGGATPGEPILYWGVQSWEEVNPL